MNTEHKGILYIVGIGPGGKEHLTVKAARAIESSQIVVGYTGYIKLISDMVDGKEVFSTGMTKEIERCKYSIEQALNGNRVSLVSSGDSGIYAMVGLVLELISHTYQSFGERAVLEVVPGVPAFVAASALLGAPLMHDFVSISLSDRLTSWDIIQKRLALASEGDFIIVLYNPRSKGRKEHLEKA
ncbi:MAG: cobalt-precorrin-3B C(17)-methyltransferase, partial [Nitrospirae bacterium]